MIILSGYNQRDMQKCTGIILIFVCIAVVIAAGCTSSESTSEKKESVSLTVSDQSGKVTVIAENIGSIESSFDVILGCYDKSNVKIGEPIAHIPSLKPGETGRGNAYLPSGTETFIVTDVGSNSRAGTYRVYYKVKYLN